LAYLNVLYKSTTKVNQMAFKKILPIFCLIVIASACYKVQPTTLEVTIKDSAGNVVPNASVSVGGESTVSPSPDLEAVYESETNSNGVVLFDLNNIYQPGQSGVAILKINAEKNDKTGSAIIELSKESNNQVDIVIE
jgi:hypothetical protein